jgi:hypothetical protein
MRSIRYAACASRTDVAGSGSGYLSTPDGLDPLPVWAVPGT